MTASFVDLLVRSVTVSFIQRLVHVFYVDNMQRWEYRDESAFILS